MTWKLDGEKIGKRDTRMKVNYYNNLGIGIIGLGAVLNHSHSLSFAKSFLIFPLLSHQELLAHLSRKTTDIKSVEKLVVDKITYFSNFNKRYYDSLSLTLNAIQYLYDTGYIEVNRDGMKLNKEFTFDKAMGKRAEKFFKASDNISKLFKIDDAHLYLNLRIEL
jgi:hypothetical protein